MHNRVRLEQRLGQSNDAICHVNDVLNLHRASAHADYNSTRPPPPLGSEAPLAMRVFESTATRHTRPP